MTTTKFAYALLLAVAFLIPEGGTGFPVDLPAKLMSAFAVTGVSLSRLDQGTAGVLMFCLCGQRLAQTLACEGRSTCTRTHHVLSLRVQ